MCLIITQVTGEQQIKHDETKLCFRLDLQDKQGSMKRMTFWLEK